MYDKDESIPKVTFYYRKPRAVANYSVEFIFKDVAQRLKNIISSRSAISRYESKGLFKRIYNTIEAVFRQGDVNHITGDVHFVGILLAKRKTIQTILDCGQLKVTTGIKHSILKYFWFELPISRCRFVTAISTATKEEILRYIHCDPDKIFVIPVAISEAFTKSLRTFNKAYPRILQIGTAPNKNIPRLIEAIQGIPCKLVIVGKYNDDYGKKLKEMGIDFQYLSGISDKEMRQLYIESDIVTLPSTYEGFGMPILEAQATGRAVLTANVTSMPEVAGDAACLVNPYDTQEIRNGILRIISDDSYRDELILKGFENVKRFNAEKIAFEYYDLYRRILSKSN